MSKLSELGQELLPWYVNKTLSTSEKSKLDLLRANSDSFKTSVDEEMNLADKMRQDDPELDEILQQQPQAFAQLRQRIAEENGFEAGDDEGHHNEAHISEIGDNESDGNKLSSISFTSRINKFRYPLAIAASFLLVAFMSVSMLQFGPDVISDSNDFVTLSTPSDSSLVVQLVFAPTAQTGEIVSLLTQSSVEVLSGPSANGVYRVRLANESDLEYWQQLEETIWAELEVN